MPMHDDVMTRAMYEFIPGGGEWTQDPPTVEGWYWNIGVFRGDTPKIVYTNGNGKYFHDRDETWDPIEDYFWWLGPLPVPAPPLDKA